MSEPGVQRKSRNRNRSGGGGSGSQRSGGGGDDLLQQMKGQVGDVVERLTTSTRDIKEQMMQKASELAQAVTDGVREEAERFFDEHKGRLGDKVQRVGKGINQAAHALRAVRAEGIADAVDSAAGRVDEVSQYLEDRNLGELVSDAGEFARRNPAPVVGGLFVAGLLAARFVKASASREDEDDESEEGSSRRSGAHGRNGRASARR